MTEQERAKIISQMNDKVRLAAISLGIGHIVPQLQAAVTAVILAEIPIDGTLPQLIPGKGASSSISKVIGEGMAKKRAKGVASGRAIATGKPSTGTTIKAGTGTASGSSTAAFVGAGGSQPVQPTLSEYVIGKPTRISSAMYDFSGCGDRKKRSKLPGYRPYRLFDDTFPGLSVVAGDAMGAEKDWVRMSRIPDTGLYVPAWTIVDDHYVANNYKQDTDDVPTLAAKIRADKTNTVGRRGEMFTGPYMHWVGHPVATTLDSQRSFDWLGIRVDGSVFGTLPTGDEKLLFTLRQDIAGYHAMTLTSDPKITFYTCAVEGCLLRVVRNGLTLVSQTKFALGLGFVTCVCFTDDKLVATAQNTGDVWVIDPVTGDKHVVCNIPGAFWVDYSSDPNIVLVVSSLDSHMYWVNLITGIKSDNIFPADHGHINFNWGTISIDSHGVAGPVDSIFFIRSAESFGGVNNSVHYRYNGIWSYGRGNLDGVAVGDESNHYGWGAFVNKYPKQPGVPLPYGRGLVRIGGHSDIEGTEIRIARASDPKYIPYNVIGNSDPGAYNRFVAGLGRQGLIYGAPATEPPCKWPSGLIGINSSGWGAGNWFGDGCPDQDANGDSLPRVATADERNARRKAWIYSGFGGNFPNRGFENDDFMTASIGFFLLLQSEEYERYGFDALNEWWTAFPADMMPVLIPSQGDGNATPYPNVPPYTSHFLLATPDGPGLTVTYEDKDTGKFAIPDGLLIRLYADYKLPGQRELGMVQADGTKSIYWPGPIDLPPRTYITSAIAPGHVSGTTYLTVNP